MMQTMALALLMLLQGEVTYYNPHIMERVYERRLAWEQLEPCDNCIGMIAVACEPNHIGKRAYITRPGLPPEGPFLIADCGTFITPGRIAEVDWQTSRRWRMQGSITDAVIFIMPSHR